MTDPEWESDPDAWTSLSQHEYEQDMIDAEREEADEDATQGDQGGAG